MRPAYETLVAAIKQDINRIDDYEWTHITERLLMHATPSERFYLEKELNDLRYEYTTAQLSKLILGVRDAPEEISPVRNFYGDTNILRTPAMPYIPTSAATKGVNVTDPRQMELDL
jgi:hypothetical protein